MEAQLSESSRSRAGTLTFLLVLACFVLSGFAALVYQTAWMRQFSVVFGTSELAVATVLSAYMAGLALGAAIAGKLVDRVRRPVLTYGLLELGIAAGAVLVPVALGAARGLQEMVLGGQEALVPAGGTTQSVFYLLTAFVVLLVPTTFMGATLPLLTRYVVRTDAQVGTRVGMLYAMNTAGAVGGTVVAAFVLLPRFGLAHTILVGVAVNAAVFVLAALIATTSKPIERVSPEARERAAREPRVEGGDLSDGRARWILPLILVSGAVSFTYEVLWTRMLAHVLGGSVYAFATMLAAFLTGITIGSAIAAALARRRRGSAFGFLVTQVGIAVLSIAIYLCMAGMPIGGFALDLPKLFDELTQGDYSNREVGALVSMALLLPATLCIGATFPFALRVLATSRDDASRASARVYAWNTVGAIAGAIAAGFVLIPAFGFHGAVKIAVVANLGLALATGVLLCLPSFKLAVLASAAALGVAIVFFQPTPPEKLLVHSTLEKNEATPELLFSEVGRSATVVLLEMNGLYEVRSNGLPEAEITPIGLPPFGRNPEWYLTVLPVLARPQTESMMVIGFGGGVALEMIPPSVKEIDVVELEPEILEANRQLSGLRAIDPFEDSRMTLVLNDARGAMNLTDKKWDIIVSQPSHPWTAGASHLYTKEFLELSKSHLTEDGVFVQWIGLQLLDQPLFESLGATLLDTFEHVRLYRPLLGMLIFLASDEPLEVELDLALNDELIAANREFYNRVGLGSAEDVAALLALDRAGLADLCSGAVISTDNRNQLAMRSSPKLEGGLRESAVVELFFPRNPLFDAESELSRALEGKIDRSALARHAIYMTPLRAITGVNAIPDGPERWLARGLARSSFALGAWGEGMADLRKAFDASQNDDRMRFALLRYQMPLVARASIGTEGLQRLAAGLSGAAAKVYEGWKLAVREDWTALRELDADLALAAPVDVWFQDAVQLRCLWRLGLARAGTEPLPGAALEALALIDGALMYEPNPDALLVRLDASELAELPQHVLGTLQDMAQMAGPRAGSIPPQMIASLVAGFRAWGPRLQELTGKDGIDDERLALLSESIAEILAKAGPAPTPLNHDPAQGASQEFR